MITSPLIGFNLTYCRLRYFSLQLTSDTKKEHEFDFEFLGSPDANPKDMLIQTNYFNNANGGHEKRSKFHFDPSEEYHIYTIVWASDHAEYDL